VWGPTQVHQAQGPNIDDRLRELPTECGHVRRRPPGHREHRHQRDGDTTDEREEWSTAAGDEV